MPELRKLAAIDIALLGRGVIIAEFAGGVLLCAGLGLFAALRSHSITGRALGAYLIAIGLNYVPMLVYALRIGPAKRPAQFSARSLQTSARRWRSTGANR